MESRKIGSAFKSSAICLPVTALHIIELDWFKILLVGQGPFLHAHDLETKRRLLTTQAFDVQAIHSICHGAFVFHDPSALCVSVALSGGSSITILSLTVEDQGFGSFIHEANIFYSDQVADWILKLHSHTFSSGLEEFVFLTAANTLYKVTSSGTPLAAKKIVEWAKGPKSSLYSGDISSHHADYVLVASGSVFGGVLVWQCQRVDRKSESWASRARYRFPGHDGSVFGICISAQLPIKDHSARLVASCSDDRTIHVWDISDHEHKNDEFSPLDETKTGFDQATDSQAHRAKASGHLSRIWGVRFLSVPCESDDPRVFLLSRGEDATCQSWSLDIPQIRTNLAVSFALTPTSSDHHHAGKNVLSLGLYKRGACIFLISGGADGRIIDRTLALGRVPSEQHVRCSFEDISVLAAPASLKDYLLLDKGKVVVLTTSGEVLQFCNDGETDQSWSTHPISSLAPVTKVSSNAVNGVIALATEHGVWISSPSQLLVFVPVIFPYPIAWLRIVSFAEDENQDFETRLVITFAARTAALLIHINTAYIDYAPKVHHVSLAKGFVTTSACYHSELDVLLLASRGGSLAIYAGTHQGAERRSSSVHQVHGTDAVTSLRILEVRQSRDLLVLSTGRDRTYAIHEITLDAGLKQHFFRTLYKMSPPFAMDIEGATTTCQSDSSQQELTLFGFRSTNFIAWNQTKQTLSLSVPCGGAHRTWAYNFDRVAEEHNFVWTKASTFNHLRDRGSEPTIVAEGGHGREIKSLAIRPVVNNKVLVATGAEDTTIRLFALEPSNETKRLEEVAVLSSHTTGAQHLAFSLCGHYLFSSGGNGELFVWSLKDDIPLAEVGVTLFDRMPQEPIDSDARILSFDVLSHGTSEAVSIPDRSFYIVTAYSNGKVRGSHYRPGPAGTPGTGGFELQMEVIYGAFCLMEVQLHSSSLDHQMVVLAAGSNGCINRSFLNAPEASSSTRVETHSIHQNSILAMDCIDVGSAGCLVVTGGDDNGLGVTIAPPWAKADSPEPRLRTILVPKAHAAALTALKIVYHEERPGWHALVVVTAGNDQRVKTWGIKLQTSNESQSELLDDLQVFKLHEAWTCVADLSSVELLSPLPTLGQKKHFEMIVVGVGMEVLRMTVDDEAVWEWQAD